MIQSPGSLQNEVRDAPQGKAFMSAIDGGLLSLAMIAGYYRIACEPAQMAHDLGLGHRAANAEDIVRAARRLGLKARALPDQPPKRLRSAPLPGILQMRDGRFAILTHRLDDGRLRIIRPLTRAQSFETLEDVTKAWSGELVLVTRRLGGPRGSHHLRFQLVPALDLALSKAGRPFPLGLVLYSAFRPRHASVFPGRGR